MEETTIRIIEKILEEQIKQTKILQTIASSLKDNKENKGSDIEFSVDGTKI